MIPVNCPIDMYQRYKHLDIRCFDNELNDIRLDVGINKYYINTYTDKDKEKHLTNYIAFMQHHKALYNFKRRTDIPSKIRQLIPKELRSHQMNIMPAFIGKGSPDLIKFVVETAIATGLIAPKNHQSLKQIVQNYCDINLGIDCSGFVNNYFRAIRPEMKQDRLISDYFKHPIRIRNSWNEINRNDVLIWVTPNGSLPNSKHIAVVDHRGGNKQAGIIVAESTGAANRIGPCITCYEFIKEPAQTGYPGVFLMSRPIANPNARSLVKVVQPF